MIKTTINVNLNDIILLKTLIKNKIQICNLINYLKTNPCTKIDQLNSYYIKLETIINKINQEKEKINKIYLPSSFISGSLFSIDFIKNTITFYK